MQENKKWTYFLPNVFTALNMACGYVSIIWAIKGQFYQSCTVLILGALFDSVDGRIARLTGTESSFGEQFDSMSDLLSFGVAPSLLFYHKFLGYYGKLGMMTSFLFMLCTAMRLARFNANIDKISSDYFQGIPSPMAAMGLVGFCLLSFIYPAMNEKNFFPLIYIMFYALLMISTIPFPSFKNSLWIKNHKHQTLFLVIFLILCVLIYEKIMIMLILSLYVIGTFINYIVMRKELKDVFHQDSN
jgi:CDP-diacylglycerol--serine O-phosphatidyltransferase